MAKVIKFKREYFLHRFTQNHLKELFDLEFVASEIQRKKLRFDNLAFDEKTNSFAIIEYKNRFDRNVINQARSYSNLIQNEENRKYFLNRLDKQIPIDFDNTKIMIIGPKFSQDQVNDAKDNGFELWKVTLFDDCKVTYENLMTDEIKTLKIRPDDLKITEDMLLENKSEKLKDLYTELTTTVLNEFSEVHIRFFVDMFSFRIGDELLCTIKFLKDSLNIYIYADNLNNAERTSDISNKSYAEARYMLKYKSNEDLDYFMNLFRQTYNQRKCEK